MSEAQQNVPTIEGVSEAFANGLTKELDEIVTHYPERRAAMLPVLWVCQKRFKWISPEVAREVAQYLKVPTMKVREVISFYTMFHSRPMGEHHIQICQDASCVISGCGCEDLADHLAIKLDLGADQTTEDGKFTLTRVACIGECEYAPAMQINETNYRNVTVDKLDEILDSL